MNLRKVAHVVFDCLSDGMFEQRVVRLGNGLVFRASVDAGVPSRPASHVRIETHQNKCERDHSNRKTCGDVAMGREAIFSML